MEQSEQLKEAIQKALNCLRNAGREGITLSRLEAIRILSKALEESS